MKMQARAKIAWLLGMSALTGIAWGGREAGILYLNNDRVSTRVVWIDGAAYVPVNDVAAALHGSVRRRANMLTIDTKTPHEAGNSAAKSLLKDGWIFSVEAVKSVPSYTEQYTRSPKALTPPKAGDRFIVIECALQNDQKESVEVWIHEQYRAELVDTSGKSSKPIGCDTTPPSSIWDVLKAGSQKKFALIFSLPAAHTPSTLRYQVHPVFTASDPKFEISLRP